MTINFHNLQKETIADYNRLIALLKNGEVDPVECEITISGYQLETALRNLHNQLAVFGSLSINGEKGYLDGAEVKMESFDFDELID